MKLARVITPEGKVINVARKDIIDIPVPMPEGSKFILPNVRVKSVQYPGLGIGSAVERVVESRTFNPVMEGQFDAVISFEGWDPILSQVYTISAPQAMKLRWLVKDGALDTAFTAKAGRRILTWSRRDIPKIVYEPMMPFFPENFTRLLVATEPDWHMWSSWYYKLCSTQYKVDAALQAEIDRLTLNCPDEAAKIRALYNFVDTKVRYVETSYSGKKAGYQPESINLTYAKRYGVCRDKAALLVGMLRNVGVDAYIVLINPGSQTDRELPVDQFNHAVVAIQRQDGSRYFLDPTAENCRQFFAASEMNRNALVCTEPGEGLSTTPLVPADSNMLDIRITDTLRADGGLSGSIAISPAGMSEFRWRSTLKHLAPAEQKQTVERFLGTFGPATTLDTLFYTDPNDMDVPLTLGLHFTTRDFATVLSPKSKIGNLKPTIRFTLPKSGTGMFGNSPFSWAASMPTRTYPLDFHTTYAWHLKHEMTIPKGYRPRLLPDTLRLAYDRFGVESATWAKGNRITNEVSFRLNHPYVPLDDYQNLRRLLTAAEGIERQHVMLKPSEE